MTYTGRGLLASRTESPGTAEVATESYTYNIEGRQLTRVDARGFTWTTVWNTCCGRQQGSYDPYGHGSIVNVDNLGRATHTATVSNVTAHSANYKDPIDAQTLGETTTKYDSRGRVTARTAWLTPLGQVDPNNVPIYTGTPVNDSANPPAAPYGLTTTYAYDDNLTDNTGLDATFSAHLAGLSLGADSDGSAVLTTNPAGERTLAIRDGLGRGVRSVQLAADNTALVSHTSTFDTVVNISGYGDILEMASANALGHTNRSRTDGAGRTIQTLDATNAITAFTYDANGRRLSVRDPNSVGQDCTYDALGRDLTCTDTAGAVTSRTYDLAGQVRTQTDAKGKVTTMAYDSRGRRLTLTDRIAATTTWTYDPAGNELSMTDAEGQTTVYTYDNSGRRTSIQWPDHVAGQNPGDANCGIETTAFDPAGRGFRKTNQLGDTMTSVYDMGSRVTARQYRTLANSPAGTTSSVDTFTYDAASRLLTGVKGLYSNTVAMAYDAGGRKASESLTIAGQTYTVGTAYDTAGRVNQLTYPDGSVVARTYDSRNLLSTIALGGGNIDSRTYDTGGRLSSETLGNGQVVARTYMTGDNLPLAISNSAVGTYSYGWDANKNKTGETITGAMASYTSTMGFDDQNRLTSWNRSNGNSQAWTLSAVNDWQNFTNNGTAIARTHGPTHEVLTVGSAAITHDSRGNMTGDEFAIARTYDVDNKVSQAVVPSGSARGIVGTHAYQYDVLGRRVRKTIGGANASDTVFAHAGEQIVADYSAGTPASSTSTKYLWGSYIDELVCQAAGSSRFYPHRNQQYSTIALSDAIGSVTERYAYTSYGDMLVLNAAGTSVLTSPPQCRYTYTGREYDHETGSYHFRNRIYLPSLGRFPQHDPILYPDGHNTYAGWFHSHLLDPQGREQCNIDIFVGHNSDVANWIDEFDDCPSSQFLGPLGCALDLEKDTTRDYLERENPCALFTIPEWEGVLYFREAPNALATVFVKAKKFASDLCKRRAKRPKCCKGMPFPTCESVNINIKCDPDMVQILKTGMDQDGNVIRVNDGQKMLCGIGTPTEGKFTRSISCGKRRGD
ncbi:MAG: RHS repeat protein [Planctomycetota bacterium]|nr:MAG: RHS repeat protein [Planctomycetota bacterium]